MVSTLSASNRGTTVLIQVDADTAERFQGHGISIGSHGYPQISGVMKGRVVLLHRVIVNAQRGQYVDHINGERFDCRRSNLRICTNSENGRNRTATRRNVTGFKGVRWEGHSKAKPYVAKIKTNGKQVHLGSFPTAESAARAYDAAAQVHHGAFARLNFPQGVAR